MTKAWMGTVAKHRHTAPEIATKLAMAPVMHAVVARKAFAACMPEGFDVAKYLDTHIDLYLHGISK